jgi:hypothetical protein
MARRTIEIPVVSSAVAPVRGFWLDDDLVVEGGDVKLTRHNFMILND